MGENETSSAEAGLYGGGPDVPQLKPIGLLDQFIGVFTEPIETFKKLNVSPSWGWALGAMIALGIVVTLIWGLKVDVDAMIRPIMEANPKIPADQIDTIIEMQKKFIVPIGLLGVLFGAPTAMLMVALFYWLIGKGTAEGNPPSYLQALSATVVPGLALVPQSLMIAAMCLLRPVGGLTPEKLSPSSLGFFLHPENPKLYALFCQLDVFILFNYVLIYLAARHLMKLKPIGAAACTALSVVFALLFRVLLAK